MLGTGGTVGVGPDGVAGTGDELALPTVAAPEVEIRGTNAIASGLTIGTSNVTIRGLAIFGFGVANIDIAQNSNNAPDRAERPRHDGDEFHRPRSRRPFGRGEHPRRSRRARTTAPSGTT